MIGHRAEGLLFGELLEGTAILALGALALKAIMGKRGKKSEQVSE